MAFRLLGKSITLQFENFGTSACRLIGFWAGSRRCSGGGDSIRTDPPDARLGHIGPCAGKGTFDVDRPACVLEHKGFKAASPCIERGPGDAEICGKPCDEDAAESAVPEIACKAGGSHVIGLIKSGIAVNISMEAFAQYEGRMRDRDAGCDRRSFGALNAMVGPEDLEAVGQAYRLEGPFTFMRRSKGTMSRRMPVLRQHHILEALCESIDDRDDPIPFSNRKASTGKEGVLHVHDKQYAVIADRDFG